MADGSPKAWTDAEKASFMLKIIDKMGPIPWNDIELPEGRTQKACKCLFERERQRYKNIAAGGSPSKTAGKKRSVDDDDDEKKRHKKATKDVRASKFELEMDPAIEVKKEKMESEEFDDCLE